MDYKDYLKYYPAFPVKGVNFVDILPLLQDKAVFSRLIDDLGALVASPNIVAPEARGFLFAAPMLVRCPHVENIVLLRKAGKLPYREGDLVEVDISKEYGQDRIFFRLSDIAAGRPAGDTVPVTFFDDVLATGGTARGIAEGLERHTVTIDGKPYRIRVTDFVFLVAIDTLQGRDRIEDIAPVKALIHI